MSRGLLFYRTQCSMQMQNSLLMFVFLSIKSACQVITTQSSIIMRSCVLNKWTKTGTKTFAHFWDILIFMLGYFILAHPVHYHTASNTDVDDDATCELLADAFMGDLHYADERTDTAGGLSRKCWPMLSHSNQLCFWYLLRRFFSFLFRLLFCQWRHRRWDSRGLLPPTYPNF